MQSFAPNGWLSQTTCYCIDGIGRSVTNGKTQNQEFINFGDESFNNLMKVLIWVELEGIQDLCLIPTILNVYWKYKSEFKTSVLEWRCWCFLFSKYQVSCTNVCRKQIKHQKERAVIKKSLVQNMYNSLAPTLRFETTTFNKARPSISQMTSSLLIYVVLFWQANYTTSP